MENFLTKGDANGKMQNPEYEIRNNIKSVRLTEVFG